MRNYLINLHTSGNSKPIGLLKLGELAIQHINNNPSDCRIYIDTATDTTGSSESTIVEFVPKSYVDNEINKLLKFIENPELINYTCLDSSATPVVVNDGYIFDSGVTEITPCTYDLSNITTLNTDSGATVFPSGLTSIVANMESLESTNITEETMDKISFMGCKNLKEVNLYLPNLTDGSLMFYGLGMLYGNNSIELNAILPNLTNGYVMFAACTLDKWNIPLPKLTNGGGMFGSCTALTNWNIELPNLTYGEDMFRGCTSLTSFTSDLSSLTNGDGMFSGCKGLTSFTSDLSSLTSGGSMFSTCSGLTSWDIPLPNLTSGNSMFSNCSGLTSWNIELPSLTSGSSMFSGCRSLSSFTSDLSSLTSGNSMFYNCSGLTSWDIPLPKLTAGSNMFFNCSGLTSFNAELPNVTNGSYMFRRSSSLTSFTSDLSSLTSGNSMFYNCSGLTNVTLSGTLNCNSLDFSDSTGLTVDSMVNIINALADRTGQRSYTLTLGSTNLAKLSAEQKAVATNKNWVLA